jgi:hypothetical protein
MNYLQPGLYPALRIKRCYIGGMRGTIYVVELEVVCSEVEEHAVGDTVFWLMRPSLFLADFLSSIMGLPFDDRLVDTARDVFQKETNPLVGRLVRCKVVERKTPRGFVFKQARWSPL